MWGSAVVARPPQRLTLCILKCSAAHRSCWELLWSSWQLKPDYPFFIDLSLFNRQTAHWMFFSLFSIINSTSWCVCKSQPTRSFWNTPSSQTDINKHATVKGTESSSSPQVKLSLHLHDFMHHSAVLFYNIQYSDCCIKVFYYSITLYAYCCLHISKTNLVW